MTNPTHISDRLSTYRTIGNRNSKDLNPIAYRNNEKQIDRVLQETSDLIDNPKYKGWFANQARRLGPDRYHGIASEVRQAVTTTPGRLFVDKLRRT